MLTEINLEQYLETKEDIALAIVVFLLGGEIHLIGDSSWLRQTMLEVYAVQLNEDDFKSMDIGVHPKTFIIKDGKEIFEINGIPTEDALGELYES